VLRNMTTKEQENVSVQDLVRLVVNRIRTE